MGGLGLVGRISGVGKNSSRVILLTDVSSSIPAIAPKTGTKGLIIGDNSTNPALSFFENSHNMRAGIRLLTSGEGRVFPPNLLIGTVVLDTSGKFRVNPAAKLNELNYLRVLLKNNNEILTEPGSLIIEKSSNK